VTDARPHDERCETARQARGEMPPWPETWGCNCASRRQERSKTIPDRPVRFTWLHGKPLREDAT
jgi:hypothetical protein